MSAKNISFIIPVYKVPENYLRECLDSMLMIKGDDIEIILIDDGSPDNCGLICDEYARRDTRIIVKHKPNEGVSRARNMGIDMAVGKYISFVDADDWISSDEMMSICTRVRESDADLIIYGQFIEFKNSSIRIRPFTADKNFDKEEQITNIRKMVFVRGYGTYRTDINAGVICNTVDKFIKRDLLKTNEIKFNNNLSMSEDSVFYFQLIGYCKRVEYVDICAYHYRMRKNSACHNVKLDKFYNVRKFVEVIDEIIKKEKLDKTFEVALSYRCFDLVFEQLQLAYCVSSDSMVKKIGCFQKEMSQYPFRRTIKQIDYKYLTKNMKWKAVFFKTNFSWLFLLIVLLKRKLVLRDNSEEMYD